MMGGKVVLGIFTLDKGWDDIIDFRGVDSDFLSGVWNFYVNKSKENEENFQNEASICLTTLQHLLSPQNSQIPQRFISYTNKYLHP
jgi:hypothetical protein